MEKRVVNLLPLIPIFLLLDSPFIFRGFIIQSNVLTEFVVLQIAVFLAFSALAYIANKMGRMYLILSLLSLALASIFTAAGSTRFIPLFFVSFIISIGFFMITRKRGDLAVGSITMIVLAILLVLSTSLRLVHSIYPQPGPGYLFSIYNDSPPVGVPFTYAYGLVFVVGQFSLTLSPATAFLFPLIAYLTADNTILVINSFRSNGVVSISAVVVT
ncbi:MAG: hypothetical protein QXU18_13555, partial [Thermoplasmatales archaeon]